ncbi:MAG TPA: hypothetical protein VN821_14775 [Candidatus Udaeobacter sp.]|nr:hypothetical protein [Candidatus Udaeobacter sp.]
MTDKIEDGSAKTAAPAPEDASAQARRPVLKRLGRFAAVTAPAVTLLLAAQTKPSKAVPPSLPPVSSRQLKTAERAVDVSSVLAGVAALPVDAWRYRPETGLEQQIHIGPYAEDFRAAFGVGDGATISTIDAIGVCLAAIRALSEKVETLEAELRETRRTGA